MIASFEERTGDRPAQPEEAHRAVADVVAEAGDESFPASDAPSWTPTVIGPPPREPRELQFDRVSLAR
jgi:hypothetical protein